MVLIPFVIISRVLQESRETDKQPLAWRAAKGYATPTDCTCNNGHGCYNGPLTPQRTLYAALNGIGRTIVRSAAGAVRDVAVVMA
eukprot:380389-Pyramimonas_sp.AAC.1